MLLNGYLHTQVYIQLTIGRFHSFFVSQENSMCNKLGVPLALDKLLGPSTVLPFLGIELDTATMELYLPADKLHSLQSLVKSWQGKKSATKVVKPGRTFVRRMIDLATTANELHHHIRLNRGFQSDLLWWSSFLNKWNGVGMLPTVTHLPPNQSITSDASGTWGCAAFWDTCWFALPWEGTWEDVHITIKELLPIVLACAIWGKYWKGQRLVCYCDNAVVVAIINSGSSKKPLAMHLMRLLFFVSAHNKAMAYNILVSRPPPACIFWCCILSYYQIIITRDNHKRTWCSY